MPLPLDVARRLGRNLNRVDHLIWLYTVAFPAVRGRRPVATSDILRTATVFLHASLEDFLRAVAVCRLPSAPAQVLNSIPLVGLGVHGRPEKFWLGALAPHRGKLVDGLIRESIDAYLLRTNYNSTADIVTLLEACAIDLLLGA